MQSLNSRTTGWITIAAGIITFSLPIAVSVSAALGDFNTIFAALGDYLGAIAILMVIPMLIAVGRMTTAGHNALGRAAQIMGSAGALIEFSHYFLIISGLQAYEQAVVWSTVGRGLIGVAILAYGLLNRENPALRRLYLWLGIVVGIAMAGSFIVLIIPLYLILGGGLAAEDRRPDRLSPVLVSAGALLECVLFFLIANKTLAADRAVWGHVVGIAAMGLAILLAALRNGGLNPRHLWLTIALGWVIAQTALGPGLDNLFDQLAQGGSLDGANPILLVMLLVTAPLYLLGWPIWLVWTGRLLLKGRQFALARQTGPNLEAQQG